MRVEPDRAMAHTDHEDLPLAAAAIHLPPLGRHFPERLRHILRVAALRDQDVRLQDVDLVGDELTAVLEQPSSACFLPGLFRQHLALLTCAK